MSQELFEMIRQMDLRDTELQLALQCAPLISGLKLSNLLIIRPDQLREVKHILRGTDICCQILLETEEKVTVLLYDQERLAAYLSERKVSELLRKMGYESNDITEILLIFCRRYQTYMEQKQTFPHEMGVLLGYPIEDVEGFIQNNGQDFLCTGYWKVYGNLPAKERLFQRFEHVRETMIQLISCGMSVVDIIDIYSEEKTKKVVG
ncbi:MAG: DUF3793 family protein [Lachnospiraceae bacterium]